MSPPAGLLGGWGDTARSLLRRGHGPEVRDLGPLALIGRAPTRAGRWALRLEGGLTNAPELASRLQAPNAGAEELIAHAHERDGAEAVLALRGAFVLVALDCDRGVGLVSRDQLGGRPLVYMPVGDGALFAEHERDVLAVLPRSPAPDRLSLISWVDTGTIPPRRTLFDGMSRLPGGHRLVFSGDGFEVDRYWKPRYEITEDVSRELAVERLREAAFDAVERASARAGHVGLRLSGGLDSACVAAGLADRRSDRQEAAAFSAVFPGLGEADERPLIEATALKTGLSVALAEIGAGASLMAPAIEHIERWRVPPATPNLALASGVGALAREARVEVMLDGEGGDELFGLSPYLIADMLRAGRPAEAWRLTALIPGVGPQAARHIRMRALRFYGARALVPAAAWRMQARRDASRSRHTIAGGVDALALVELNGGPAWRALDGPLWWRSLAADLGERDRNVDVAGHLRRQSLDAGFEGRHPFLYDLELANAVLTIPPRLQFDSTRDRPLLRDGLVGRVPEAVLTRHAKSYFNGLLARSLANEGRLLLDELSSPDAPLRGYADPERLDGVIREGREHPEALRATGRLWRAGVIDQWLRSLGEPESLRESRARLAAGAAQPAVSA